MGQLDQSETRRAQDADEVRQRDQRRQIRRYLKDAQREEVAQDRLVLLPRRSERL